MNILVTGGSGFIGRNVLESTLAEKYRLFAPRHSELELMDEDAVRDYIRNKKIEVIIHTAAKPGHRNAKDPSGICFTNSRIFFNLARNSDIFRKMIVTGSGAIYDMRNYQPKMKEEYFNTHVPMDEHGFSKYIMEKAMENSDKMVDLRIFGIFGKYEDYAIRFISNMICKSLFGLSLTMKQNRKFDYLYINDLIPILDYFIQNNVKYRDYNVTPDQSVELYQIAEKVREISGKDLPILTEQEGLGKEYSGDNSRLRKEMNKLAFTPIDSAISELYGWYEANIGSIDKQKLTTDK